MYLPVPVNFVFIGFEGNGNQGIWRVEMQLIALAKDHFNHLAVWTMWIY